MILLLLLLLFVGGGSEWPAALFHPQYRNWSEILEQGT